MGVHYAKHAVALGRVEGSTESARLDPAWRLHPSGRGYTATPST